MSSQDLSQNLNGVIQAHYGLNINIELWERGEDGRGREGRLLFDCLQLERAHYLNLGQYYLLIIFIIIVIDCGIMQAQKKVPPKPEGLKKKEERNQKIQTSLKQLREKRRAENNTKRTALINRSKQYLADYQKATQDELNTRRAAKLSGSIHVPAQPKVAFVIRIRGINKLDPRSVRILRLLRLRQIHNGAFIRINKASTNLLRKVEPYITFGYPTRENIQKLIYKRGFGKINHQRIPLTNNRLVDGSLGKFGISSVDDLVNEIHTVGPHFKEANNFLWTFKLRGPRGGFSQKRHPFQRRGDWGNRENLINDLIKRML